MVVRGTGTLRVVVVLGNYRVLPTARNRFWVIRVFAWSNGRLTVRPAKYGFHVYVTRKQTTETNVMSELFFYFFRENRMLVVGCDKTLLLVLLVVLSSRVPRYYNLDLQYVVRT